MPRYTVKFEETHSHRLVVEVDAADEQEAYQKVYQSDYNVSDPVHEDDILTSKRVFDNSAVLVMPISYRGPFM